MSPKPRPLIVRELVSGAVIYERLGVSRWTWARWVASGDAPSPVPNLPGWPKWRRSDIDLFAAGCFRGDGKRTYFNSARRRAAIALVHAGSLATR